MKKIVLSIAILATAALFSACSKNDGSSNNASVMFVNGCTETSNIAVSANNVAVPSAQALAFLGNSGYQPVGAGTAIPFAFNITASGSSSTAPLTSGTLDLTAGVNYSVFAAGKITSPSYCYSMDNLAAPPAGDANIRLVNLSSDNLSLTGTVTLGGTTTTFASGIGSVAVSPAFISVPAGSYKIVVEDTAASLAASTVAILPAQTLTAGTIYTVIYTGTSAGTGTFGYTATVITNN